MLNFIEKPASGNSNKYLIIFLHGYGCDKNDLMPLSKDFSTISNEICFLSVDAPELCSSGYGYQWFPLETLTFTPKGVYELIRNDITYVKDFIEKQSYKLNIDYKNIFLVGFSQGAMVALASALRFDKKIGGVISFSGFQPDTKETLELELKTKQNILLIHGTDDLVVPYGLMAYSKNLLESFGIDVKTYTNIGVDHCINAQGLMVAVDYVRDIISQNLMLYV